MQVPQNQLARSAKVSKEGPRITRSGTVEIYIHISILVFNYNLRGESIATMLSSCLNTLAFAQ